MDADQLYLIDRRRSSYSLRKATNLGSPPFALPIVDSADGSTVKITVHNGHLYALMSQPTGAILFEITSVNKFVTIASIGDCMPYTANRILASNSLHYELPYLMAVGTDNEAQRVIYVDWDGTTTPQLVITNIPVWKTNKCKFVCYMCDMHHEGLRVALYHRSSRKSSICKGNGYIAISIKFVIYDDTFICACESNMIYAYMSDRIAYIRYRNRIICVDMVNFAYNIAYRVAGDICTEDYMLFAIVDGPILISLKIRNPVYGQCYKICMTDNRNGDHYDIEFPHDGRRLDVVRFVYGRIDWVENAI